MSDTSPDDVGNLLRSIVSVANAQGYEVSVPPPLDARRLQEFMRQHSLDEGSELPQLLRFSDGLSVGGLSLCPEAEIFVYGQDLLAIQNWGNGDFDCLVLSDVLGWPTGAVVFTNHQSDVRVQVAKSIHEWLSLVRTELLRRGEVLHPRDYLGNSDSGVYAHVLGELQHRQCELSRWAQRLRTGG